MKIPNKGKLQEIIINHSPDIDFKDSIKLYQKNTVKPYPFLVNDITLTSDSLFRFRQNLVK